MSDHKSAQSNKGDTNDIDDSIYKIRHYIGDTWGIAPTSHQVKTFFEELITPLIAQETNKAQQQLLRELIEQLPPVWATRPDKVEPSSRALGYNDCLDQVTALLNKKLQAYGGE